MSAVLILMLATAGCSQDASQSKGAVPCQGSVQLMKTYRQPVGDIAAGTTFRQASLENFAICQEIADMYNASPSVQRAPAQLLFFCSTGEQK